MATESNLILPCGKLKTWDSATKYRERLGAVHWGNARISVGISTCCVGAGPAAYIALGDLLPQGKIRLLSVTIPKTRDDRLAVFAASFSNLVPTRRNYVHPLSLMFIMLYLVFLWLSLVLQHAF